MASTAQLHGAQARPGRVRYARKGRWAWEPTVLLAPAMLLFLVFLVVPVGFSFYLSFVDWNLMNPNPTPVGLQNYVSVLKDPVFRLALRNTLVYVLATVPVSAALGLGLAVLVESATRARQFYRFVFFIPAVTSVAVVGVIWSLLLSPKSGLINTLLQSVGISGPNWLQDPKWALIALIGIGIWKSFGYNMILYIPGLKNIDKQVYEAAQIDGADRWQQFWHMTLPLLSPVSFFVVTTSLIGSFQVFATVQVMTQGGPNNATNMLAYYVWQEALQFFDAGRGSAAATLLFLLMAGLVLLRVRTSERSVHYR